MTSAEVEVIVNCILAIHNALVSTNLAKTRLDLDWAERQMRQLLPPEGLTTLNRIIQRRES